jgi:DNA-3-methyladenine glycosylase
VRISRAFFEGYTPEVAKGLLGCRLVRVLDGERLAGIVVETEAYRGARDPASHAYRGRTKRNEVMFGPAGHAYVYFTMGRHYCLNVTTEPEGTPAAVLIRALEPVGGVEKMRGNRGLNETTRLASGPGNLTKALGIDRTLNGEDMVESQNLFFEGGEGADEVEVSSRIGISAGTSFRWRFFVKGNRSVSKGKPSFSAQNL